MLQNFQQILSLVAGLLVDLLIGGFGLWMIVLIVQGKIDLTRLISEPNGDASMSRFQLLIFTLVVALSLFVIVVGNKTPQFPDIPGSILSLLGISASSYLVSKGIQFSNPEGVKDRVLDVMPHGVQLAPGTTQQFNVKVGGTATTEVKWTTSDPTLGTITDKGLYTAVATPPAGTTLTVRATTPDGTTGTAAVL